MTEVKMQAGKRLVDKSSSGRERPWEIHKMNNCFLSRAYEGIGYVEKSARLRDCASVLVFCPLEAGGKRLAHANFCRVGLCPVCTWRKSLKVQAQVHSIMQAMAKDTEGGGKKYAFVYLTLTVRNCEGRNLSRTLDEMNEGFRRLTQRKAVKDAVKGYFKSIEVTHNVDRDDEWYDTYHPHIHVLIAVNPSYFGKYYINQAEWTGYWREAMRLDYSPRVDIRKVKGNTAKAVAEAAGYGTKSSSFIIPDDWGLTLHTVQLLDATLKNRRLVGFGGVMREYHKRLNLSDPEDGDLVHINEDEPVEDNDRTKMIYYAWFSGYRQYRRVDLP